ncbi:MAG TPA: M13 family metallopeptidase [Candidatus Eisenbacteria bacterium]|nr:M13 family metallopeptidase [Candidatus Eisenbacteria bacterium]
MKTLALALACVLLASATALAAPDVPPWGLNLDYLDRSGNPGDDFYVYANGGWLKTATIPPDRPGSGVGLEMGLRNEERMKAIIADLHARPNLTDEEKKLRDLYDAFLDRQGIDAAGMKPAAGDLQRIAHAESPEAIVALMSDPSFRLGGPFSMRIDADDKNPNAYVVFVGQSGLGMPDRDYYLRDEKEIAATREAYKSYLAQMLVVAGVDGAPSRADAIFAAEREIAVACWPAADRRDADRTYNPMTLPELAKLAPGFPWSAWFQSAGIPARAPGGERRVVVAEKSAFLPIAKVFAATPVAVWRDYLTVRYLHAFAAYLPQAVDDADFAFYGTALGGRTKQLDRETRGARLLDTRMGEALGKLYVAKYFPPEAKAKIQALVKNLLAAYTEDLKTLPWLTEPTREKAMEKVRRFTVKVGYPDHWRDYSTLAVDRGDLVGSVKNAIRFAWNRDVKRIDDPVDKTEWGMTPPTVNAYNNSTANEIVFPAGILQAPDFDPEADDAVNYGAIGAVIGHEISHGFDDQGSKYDASGMLRSWWTEEDRKRFDARTNALAAQYDQYEGLPGLHVNGKLTLGENIADLAGLVIAHKAYRISLGGKEAPVRDGLTGDQRFYLGYAQSWRSKVKEGANRQRILSNPHSPPEFRVNGVVRNDDGWYAAFPDVAPGSRYYLPPEKRIHLW